MFNIWGDAAEYARLPDTYCEFVLFSGHVATLARTLDERPDYTLVGNPLHDSYLCEPDNQEPHRMKVRCIGCHGRALDLAPTREMA